MKPTKNHLPVFASFVLLATLPNLLNAADILLIGDPGIGAAATDRNVETFITALGHNVTYLDSRNVNTGDELAFDGLVISSTLGSGTARNKFHNSAIGILNWEEAIMDAGAGEFGLSSEPINKSLTTTQIGIAADHYITQDFTVGTVFDYVTAAGPETLTSRDVFGGTVLAIAVNGTKSSGGGSGAVGDSVLGDAMLYVAEPGDAVDPGSGADPAKGRRVMFPMTDTTFDSLTPEGLVLFGRSVEWIAGIPEPSSISLLGIGLLAFGAIRRRKRV